jgi:hypothetical protein
MASQELKIRLFTLNKLLVRHSQCSISIHHSKFVLLAASNVRKQVAVLTTLRRLFMHVSKPIWSNQHLWLRCMKSLVKYVKLTDPVTLSKFGSSLAKPCCLRYLS